MKTRVPSLILLCVAGCSHAVNSPTNTLLYTNIGAVSTLTPDNIEVAISNMNRRAWDNGFVAGAHAVFQEVNKTLVIGGVNDETKSRMFLSLSNTFFKGPQ